MYTSTAVHTQHAKRQKLERQAHPCMDPPRSKARCTLRRNGTYSCHPVTAVRQFQAPTNGANRRKRPTSGTAPTHPHGIRATRNRTTDCTHLIGARITTVTKFPYAPLFRAVRASVRKISFGSNRKLGGRFIFRKNSSNFHVNYA